MELDLGNMDGTEVVAVFGNLLKKKGILEEVESVDLDQGTANVGAHYGGSFKHGTITFKDEARAPIKLFFKDFPTVELLIKFAKKYRFCLKEAAFFNTLYNDMEALWSQRTGYSFHKLYQSEILEKSSLIFKKNNLILFQFVFFCCYNSGALK